MALLHSFSYVVMVAYIFELLDYICFTPMIHQVLVPAAYGTAVVPCAVMEKAEEWTASWLDLLGHKGIMVCLVIVFTHCCLCSGV